MGGPAGSSPSRWAGDGHWESKPGHISRANGVRPGLAQPAARRVVTEVVRQEMDLHIGARCGFVLNVINSEIKCCR